MRMSPCVMCTKNRKTLKALKQIQNYVGASSFNIWKRVGFYPIIWWLYQQTALIVILNHHHIQCFLQPCHHFLIIIPAKQPKAQNHKKTLIKRLRKKHIHQKIKKKHTHQKIKKKAHSSTEKRAFLGEFLNPHSRQKVSQHHHQLSLYS